MIHKKRELSRQNLTRDVNAMLATLTGTRYPPDHEPEWVRSYPRHSWMKEAMSAFRGIILAKSRVDYLADAFQGTALLLVLMVFGTLVVTQGTSLGRLVDVLIMSRLCHAQYGKSIEVRDDCESIYSTSPILCPFHAELRSGKTSPVTKGGAFSYFQICGGPSPIGRITQVY